MFEILLFLLLIAILLFVFSNTVRSWVLARIIISIQRRLWRKMQDQAQRDAYRQRERAEESRHQAHGSDRESRPYQGKLDMDDIATKKFEKSKSEDYVDFEELPQK